MIPVMQLIKHDPENGKWGDCHRAAFASILELDINEVPHFGEGGVETDEFNRRVDEFLLSLDLSQITVAYPGELDQEELFRMMNIVNKNIYCLFSGKSSIGADHTVVFYNGQIVHDPSENGIVGPCSDGFYWFIFIGKGHPVYQKEE